MDETRDHLFFGVTSPYKSGRLLLFSSSRLIPTDWHLLFSGGIKALRRSTVINIVIKLIFQASIYHIWMERNARIFSHMSKSSSLVISLALQDVYHRAQSLPKVRGACQTLATFSAL